MEARDGEAGPVKTEGGWLLTQASRDGWIGDLAKAAKADRGFPRNLNEKQAENDMLEAVDDAERIWLRL